MMRNEHVIFSLIDQSLSAALASRVIVKLEILCLTKQCLLFCLSSSLNAFEKNEQFIMEIKDEWICNLSWMSLLLYYTYRPTYNNITCSAAIQFLSWSSSYYLKTHISSESQSNVGFM